MPMLSGRAAVCDQEFEGILLLYCCGRATYEHLWFMQLEIESVKTRRRLLATH